MEIVELTINNIDDFLDLVREIMIMTKERTPEIRNKVFGNFTKEILIEILNQNKNFQFSKIFILKENEEMIGYLEVDFLSSFNKIQNRKNAIIKFPLVFPNKENLFVIFISRIIKYLHELGINSLLLFYSNLLPYNSLIIEKVKFRREINSGDEMLKIYSN